MTVKKIEEELGAEINIAEYIGEPCVENISLKLLKNIRDLINSQQAEIERLEKIRKADDNLITSLNKCYETAKAEAIKEFAENIDNQLLALRKTYRHIKEKCVVDACRFEIKEMVGEE